MKFRILQHNIIYKISLKKLLNYNKFLLIGIFIKFNAILKIKTPPHKGRSYIPRYHPNYWHKPITR